MSLSSGRRLGPYEITGVIGAGGMGEVYRARDTRLDRDVAIKVLPDLFASDADRLARFEREAKTLASLNHPNIAQIYGMVELPPEGGNHIVGLVMEFVEGQDLSQRLERGPLPLDEAMPIARQIVDAVEAAHEQGIIHRDLKPANIKLRSDAMVKVLDFGLAKAMGAEIVGAPADAVNTPTFTSPALTQIGMIVGTAAYMSPEQARGKPADRRADIWAFGVVLYEMLTGRRPFEGDTVQDLIAAVIKERVPLEHLPPDVPYEVRTLISRCLEKDPRQRLRDIGEARILLAQPSSAPTVPASAAPAAATRRSPPAVSRGFVALSAALAISLAATAWLAWRASRTGSAPVAAFEIAPPDGAELNVGFTPKVTVSPDGSMVAFVAAANGERHLYVRRRDSVTARQLPGTEDAQHPVFSPNGTWIAFFAANALKKVPLEGPVVLLTKVNNDARGLAWADGASLVYAPGSASGLMQISAEGGEPKSLTVPDTAKRQTHRWPCAVPGGKAVLYTVAQTNNQNNYNLSAIEAVTLATGERRTVLQGASMAVYVTAGHLLFTRGGTLHAVPFDAERLATTGAVVPVVQDVMDVGTGAAHVSVGGDGTLAYIPGTRNTLHRIAWLDPDGTARPVDLAPAQYNDLKISPDGARVALSQREKGVWVYDLQRKSLTRLTPGQRDTTPAWSADGRTLYYVDRSGGNTRFLRKPADGSRGPEPVAVIKQVGFLSEVLADGAAAIIEVIGLTESTDPHPDIARIRLAPGNTDTITPTNIEATQAAESAADVSPDERWMAYQSDENGTRHEVYVRDLSGSGGRWQISNAGGEEPYWSPDARRLYYRNDDALYAVAVDTRNGFSAGAPQLLFRGVDNTRNDGPRYTVDPKTGRLLMLRPATGQQTRHTIRVVLNWFEELNAKLQQAR